MEPGPDLSPSSWPGKSAKRVFAQMSRPSTFALVIPGRCEASNPESRGSPVRNCAPEVRVFDAPRNDEARTWMPGTRPGMTNGEEQSQRLACGRYNERRR